MIKAIFKLLGENPPSICIVGGILLLILSPTYSPFVGWGWLLIIIGVILQLLWLKYKK